MSAEVNISAQRQRDTEALAAAELAQREPEKEQVKPPKASSEFAGGTIPNSHKFMAKGFRSSVGVEMKAVKGSDGVYFKSFAPSTIKLAGANSITTRDRASGVIPPGWSYRSSGGHLYLVP